MSSRITLSSAILQNEIRSVESPLDLTSPACLFLYALSAGISAHADGDSWPLELADVLFLPPGRPLHLEASGGGRILLFGLEESYVTDHLDLRPLPLLASPLCPELDFLNLKRLLLSVSEQAGAPGSGSVRDADQIRLEGMLLLLLAELRSLLPGIGGAKVPERYERRVQEIADYIDQHLTESLSLPDLAEAFYLTPQYLSTFFREMFGTNFKSYLTKKRLFRSLKDLRDSGDTISEIALRSGFSSVSAYQKNFQRIYGKSPSEYRSGYRGPVGREAGGRTSAAKSPGDVKAKQAQLPGQESGMRARSFTSVRLRADGRSVSRSHVHNMINAGSVHALLSDRFRLHLLDFCHEMHIRYIRIEELLSSSFMPMILPHNEYFYQNADTVLSFFYENQLIPFVELTKLAARFEEEEGIRSASYVVRNNRFYRLLESFLKHVSRRWPASWLREWKFEMWMLPRDSAATYVRDFRRTAALIRTYIPEAGVGGPGMETRGSRELICGILDEMKRTQTRPDFWSLSLRYDHREEGGRISISPNEDLLTDSCRRVREEIAASGMKLPLYVTEWTSADPPSAPAAASRYQAAFIARTWTDLDEVCDLAGFWLYNDMEYVAGNAGPAIWHFGQGLYGNGFVPCAAFYAYAFCASLGSEVLSKGSCWQLVRAEQHHYQLLAWHYEHFRASEDPAVSDVTDFDRVYELFDDPGSVRFTASLTGLMPGLYHTTRILIDRDHGSSLDGLIREYSHGNIDRIEFLQYARMQGGALHASRLHTPLPSTDSFYNRIEGVMELSCDLPAHSVCLWDIQRQI